MVNVSLKRKYDEYDEGLSFLMSRCCRNKAEPVMLMDIDTTGVVLNDAVLCTDLSRKRNQSKSCVIDVVQYASFTNKTWIGDSGASCHLDNDGSGMYDVEDINDIIGMTDGKSTVRATKKGRKGFVVEQLDDTTAIKELYTVKYTPGISDRLLSINAELSNGVVLSSDNRNNLVLTYGWVTHCMWQA